MTLILGVLADTYVDVETYGARPLMPGQVKQMIDSILQQRAKGNPAILTTTKTKLILKGVNPDRFTATSQDDVAVVAKVRAIASEWGITI